MPTRKIQQSERAREAEGEGVPFSLADVKKLVESLEGTDVTGFVWKRGAEKVVIRRGQGGPSLPMAVHAAPVAHAIPAPPVPLAAPAAAPPAAAPKAAEKPGAIVTSPFVDVGTVVKKGQVLCIVEAMKLMNEIEAETAGKIAEIFVQNATPVEFGEKLFRIEPA